MEIRNIENKNIVVSISMKQSEFDTLKQLNKEYFIRTEETDEGCQIVIEQNSYACNDTLNKNTKKVLKKLFKTFDKYGEADNDSI